MIVLDSSAALDYVLGSQPLAVWVERQLDGASWDLHATYVIDLEVFGVTRAHVLRGSLDSERGWAALDVFARFPLKRYSHVHLFERMWSLHRHVSPTDASFVALAEALDAPLLTTDLRLARAHGHRAAIIAP